MKILRTIPKEERQSFQELFRVSIRIFLFLALSFSYSVSAEQISIMSYNLNNLFDAQDDPGKDDKAYLPIALKNNCLLYTSPSPRDLSTSRMPSSA